MQKIKQLKSTRYVSVLLILVLLMVNSVSSILADEVNGTGEAYTVPASKLSGDTETQDQAVDEANSISGVLWLDENNDGILDEEEEFISDYPVYLYSEENLNGEIQKVTTDEEGKYEFSGVESGEYRVGVKAEENESGYLLSVVEVTEDNDNRFMVDAELLSDAYSEVIVIAEDSIVADLSCGMRRAVELTDNSVNEDFNNSIGDEINDNSESVDSVIDEAGQVTEQTDNADDTSVTEEELETDSDQKLNYSISPSDLRSGISAKAPTTFSGDHTLNISWVSNTSNGTVSGASLSNTPSENTTQYATVQVDFSLSTGSSAAVEEVEIRIPYSIIEGDSLSEVSVTGAEDFEWYYDEGKNEIVLRNTVAIDSSKAYLMQIAYKYLPSDVVADDEPTSATSSSYIGSFDADLYIANTLEQSSNELDIKVTTQVVANTTTKTFDTRYELWQSEWGTALEGINTSDYFYLQWKIQYTANHKKCTQPYTISINDIIPQQYLTAGAYVVGHRYQNTSASFVSGDNFTKVTLDSLSSTLNSSYYYWYVIIAYPRTLYDGQTSIDVSNTAQTELTGIYGTTAKSNESTSVYNYATANFDYIGNLYSVSKIRSDYASGSGLINLLLNDKSVNLSGISIPPFQISATSRGYGETYGLREDGTNGYGAKKYTTNLVDDLMYLEGEQLETGDYSIDSFYITGPSFIEYDAYEDINAGEFTGVESTDYTSYSPIEIQYQTGGDGSEWKLLGTVKKVASGNAGYIFTPDGGTAQSINQSNHASLPSGTTGVKFVHSTSRYSVYIAASLQVSLHPTNHVKQLLEGKTSATLYNIDSLIVQNEDGDIVNDTTFYETSVPGTLNSVIYDRDEVIYGNKIQHWQASMGLSGASGTSGINKIASTPVNDGTNPRAKVTYTINAYDQVSTSNQYNWDDIKSFGIMHPQNEGIFYDLIPLGAYADTTSISVKNYRGGSTCTIDSVETVDNWQNSGQTMLIVKVSYPDSSSGDNQYSINANSQKYFYSGFTLTYDLYYPWVSIEDYGNSLINSVAYRAAEGTLISGGTAASASNLNSAHRQYFANLTDSTGGSANDDTDQNTIYTSRTTSVSVAMSTNVGFSKRVNSAEYPNYDSKTTAYTGENYTYQLRYRTAANVTAQNLVFYDVLEENYGTNNNYWKGTLAGIDTSYIETNYPNADVKVYYSTASGLGQNSSTPPNLADTAIWSEAPPTDLSDVTAIAVDISKNKDGSDFELPSNSTVLCYVTMTAPSAYSEYMAYNNAKCYGSMATSIGSESQFDLPSATTVNLLAKTDFEFTKVDAANDTALPDAEFSLYNWTDTDNTPGNTDLVDISSTGTWSLVKAVTTSDNGLVSFAGLTEGYYQLVETQAPAGYITPTGQWRIEVDKTGALTITAVKGDTTPPAFSGSGTAESPYKLGNIKDYNLPEMGGIGTRIFKILGGGLLLLGLAIVVIDSSRKRRGKAQK